MPSWEEVVIFSKDRENKEKNSKLHKTATPDSLTIHQHELTHCPKLNMIKEKSSKWQRRQNSFIFVHLAQLKTSLQY